MALDHTALSDSDTNCQSSCTVPSCHRWLRGAGRSSSTYTVPGCCTPPSQTEGAVVLLQTCGTRGSQRVAVQPEPGHSLPHDSDAALQSAVSDYRLLNCTASTSALGSQVKWEMYIQIYTCMYMSYIFLFYAI